MVGAKCPGQDRLGRGRPPGHASRILVQTGRRAGLGRILDRYAIHGALLRPSRYPYIPVGRLNKPPAGTYVGCVTSDNSAGGPGLQLGDQRLDRRAIALYVGLEIRTSSLIMLTGPRLSRRLCAGPCRHRGQFPTAQACTQLARWSGLQAAIDDEQAVGRGVTVADSERLAGILSANARYKAEGLGDFRTPRGKTAAVHSASVALFQSQPSAVCPSTGR